MSKMQIATARISYPRVNARNLCDLTVVCLTLSKIIVFSPAIIAPHIKLLVNCITTLSIQRCFSKLPCWKIFAYWLNFTIQYPQAGYFTEYKLLLLQLVNLDMNLSALKTADGVEVAFESATHVLAAHRLSAFQRPHCSIHVLGVDSRQAFPSLQIAGDLQIILATDRLKHYFSLSSCRRNQRSTAGFHLNTSREHEDKQRNWCEFCVIHVRQQICFKWSIWTWNQRLIFYFKLLNHHHTLHVGVDWNKVASRKQRCQG